MKIEQFVVEGLGHASYLIAAEQGQAAVVDPKRDVDTYLAAAQRLNVRISYILETHLHNDFVSGSRELQAKTGATITASAAAELKFRYQPLRDGDRLTLGELSIEMIETPGHTPEHISFLLYGPDQARPTALFSGGSLLVSTVGRTDLLGPDRAVPLARLLYRTLHEKIAPLPPDVTVYPTHGAGSLCLANAGEARVTTIGQELASNWALGLLDEDEFIRRSLEGLPPYPPYYKHMRPLNQAGPKILDVLPTLRPLSPNDVERERRRGAVVIDIRPVEAFARRHIRGALSIDLEPPFATWVGWLVPFNRPIVIVSDDERQRQHEEVVRQLVRIGYEQLAGFLAGGVEAWREAGLPVDQSPRISVEELAHLLHTSHAPVVVDVRMPQEWEEGVIPGAYLIHLGDLPEQLHALPDHQPIATICASGFRATIAASLLQQHGFRDVMVVTPGMRAWYDAHLDTTQPVVPSR